MIKKYPMALLVALTLFSGCKSGSDDNQTITDTNKLSNVKSIQNLDLLSDAEKLALAAVTSNTSTQQSNPTNTLNSRSRALHTESENCQNGGTLEYTIDDAIFNQDMDYNSPVPMTISLNNCLVDGMISHGEMKVVMQNENAGSIEYLSDFTEVGDTENILVKKGSMVSFHTEGEWDVVVINAAITYNGLVHAGENLIYKSKELSNGNAIEFPVSGKEKIGDSAYFQVDPTYDASQTPFTSDPNGDLISGTVKYLDTNTHQVVIEVTSNNIITVKVDENGDTLFSDDEISAIAIP